MLISPHEKNEHLSVNGENEHLSVNGENVPKDEVQLVCVIFGVMY